MTKIDILRFITKCSPYARFARHHDQRASSQRPSWNVEICSAVARLTDLVEERKLLSKPEQRSRNRRHSRRSSSGSKEGNPEWKYSYSIDQVRLLKALLELMSSGRESDGWCQLPKPDETEEKKTAATSNSKLLLPILQSCLRVIMPSVGIIRSEAVVIVSSGNAPSTTNLLCLVSEELHKSLDSAISSLTFSVSRDVFMSAISSLRCAIVHHQGLDDSKAVLLCSELVVAVQKGMRRRYSLETAPTSFSDSDDGAAIPRQSNSADEADSQAVENIIAGGALPKNGECPHLCASLLHSALSTHLH